MYFIPSNEIRICWFYFHFQLRESPPPRPFRFPPLHQPPSLGDTSGLSGWAHGSLWAGPTSAMSSWFEDLFGFREKTGTTESYAQTKEQFSLEGSCLTCKGNGEKFEAGIFETPSLRELKDKVKIDKIPLQG